MSNIYNNTTDQEQVEAQKDMRAIQRKAAEKKIEHDSKLDLEIQKAYLDDAKRELRRSQYSELLMNQEGRFVAVTRNLLIPSKERAALNLQAPVLERCLSYNGKGGIYKLMVTIDQTRQELYLKQRKCGNVKYLLEKISVLGGTVYGKKSQVESYIQQFWHYCLAHCVAEPVYYPDDYGWNLTGKNEVVFVREGGCTVERPVKNGGVSEWNTALGFFLTLMPLLRYLFVNSGMGLEQGLLLVVDNNQQADQFVEYLSRQFDYIMKVEKPKQVELRNYMMGIMSARRKSVDTLSGFLYEDGFFPVIVFGGCVPEELRTETYIIRMTKGDINKMKHKKFTDNVLEMEDYIFNNGQDISKLIKEIIALRKEKGNNYGNLQNFYLNVSICGDILYRLMPEQYKEPIQTQYVSEASRWIKQIGEFAGRIDIREAISDSFWEYLKNKTHRVWLADRDNLTEENSQMAQYQECIIYDDDFYYCPESLLAKICSELLSIYSLRELKQKMEEAGVLYSDQSADYTSKITFRFPSGSKRMRMIKLDKKYFISDNNEFPEQLIRPVPFRKKKNIIRVYHAQNPLCRNKMEEQ